MTYGPDGALYVAERGANRIVALVDANNDGVADVPLVVADHLIAPSSVAFAPLDGDKPSGPVKDFAAGWLKGSQASGRPVGLAVAPDGSLIVSDDKSGYIYRITYGK